VLGSLGDELKFLECYLDLIVVEVKLFKVSEAFSSKELLDKKLASGWNVYEPKVVVFGPQKDCFCRIVIDSSCVC
jgi:hypothetical protein